MVPNPIITSVTWPSSPKDEGQRLRTDISYRNDGTDGEVFSRVVDDSGTILDSFVSSVAAGEISTDSVRFYMPAHDVTIYAQAGIGSTVTSQKGPKTIYLSEPAPPPPVGIPTTLSINAPGMVALGEIFNIFGQLTRVDTGVALPNMSIGVSYNGTPLGSVLTDMQGVYKIPASIPDPGTYTLRADFAGTPEYAASTSITDTMVAASSLEAAVAIAGSAAIGLVLVTFGLS